MGSDNRTRASEHGRLPRSHGASCWLLSRRPGEIIRDCDLNQPAYGPVLMSDILLWQARDSAKTACLRMESS